MFRQTAGHKQVPRRAGAPCPGGRYPGAMNGDRRPAPPPLEANDELVTAVITACWAIALLVLFLLRGELPEASRWWLWTCLAGFVMGLFGLWYVPRMKRSRARAAERRAQQQAPQQAGGTELSAGDRRPAGQG